MEAPICPPPQAPRHRKRPDRDRDEAADGRGRIVPAHDPARMSDASFYADSFPQLASISAVLGGLAFTAAAAVLSAAAAGQARLDRSASITAGAAVASAASLVVAALTWSLLSVQAARASATGATLGADVLSLNRPASLAFVMGLVALFTAVGASGWMGSRALGAFTTAAALLAGAGALAVVFRFVH